MSHPSEKQKPALTITTGRPRSASRDSASGKTPRTARFAEATAVHSPVDTPKSLFRGPYTNHYVPQPQVSDIGFGYLKPNHESVEMEDTERRYLPPPTPASPLRSPLKSAMKSPGAPSRGLDALKSPTFREEQLLEKAEAMTDKEQARDLKAKMRVRAAKFFLRGVNFSCSLIVLSMLSTTFTIFNATKTLPPRNNLPPWAVNTKTWPQILLLSISCVSLFTCVVIFWGYFRGGHRRAEKVAVYYTTFAVFYFIFSIVMWGIGAAVLNQARVNGNGQDLWGWSCKDNTRRALFQADVSYALICRLQNWSLVCCIIEVVIEVLTILVYGIVFYRYYSKRRLRKSMATRDKARSDMYLAQLKSQSAPNTPGFAPPLSARDGGWRAPPGHPMYKGPAVVGAVEQDDEEQQHEGAQYAIASPRQFAAPKPFALQPPPIRIHAATPKAPQEGFEPAPAATHPQPLQHNPPREIVNAHGPVEHGETQYAAVAIPGSYSSPLNSPGFAPAAHQQQRTAAAPSQGFDFGLGSR